MDIMTAEQAVEAAKGLTFEKVWEALMESRIRMEESHKRTEEAQQKTQKQIDELSKNVGGVNNAFGFFIESLFSTGLDELFTELGYTFTKQGGDIQFKEKGTRRVLAEADYLLEDGEYAMVVEVKAKPKIEDIDYHLERIATIRQYFDERDDKRILVGAVAGGVVREDVLRYAQKQGLYVITQAGDSAVIAEVPQGFKAREW